MKPHIEQSTGAPADIHLTVDSKAGPVRKAGTVLGVAAVAYVGLSTFGGDIVQQDIDQQETAVDVVVEEVRAIDIDCFAAAKTVVDSSVRTKLSVAGRKLGPTGYKAAFQADAETFVCYDGAFIGITVNQETGEQLVTIDRAGKKFITEWNGINLDTDVEGALAEAGDMFAGLGDIVGIDRAKDAVNEEKAELGGLLESASKEALEGQCMTELGNELEELVEQGVYLQARNQGIDPTTVTVVFTGDKEIISLVDFGLEAGRFGFEVTGNTIEEISCNVTPGAFDNVDQRTQPALSAEDKKRTRGEI